MITKEDLNEIFKKAMNAESKVEKKRRRRKHVTKTHYQHAGY
jgi:hypothetical protein